METQMFTTDEQPYNTNKLDFPYLSKILLNFVLIFEGKQLRISFST